MDDPYQRGANWLDAVADERMAELNQQHPELADAGNAARFVAAHGQDTRYVKAWGWCTWDGKVQRRDQHLARRKMVATARAIHAEAATERDKAAQKEIVLINSQRTPFYAAAANSHSLGVM